MTRTEVATEVGRRLAGILAAVGVAATDTAGGLKEPIDDALRSLGFAAADLATAAPAEDGAFLALVEYHALRKAAAELAPRYGVALPGGLAAQRQHAFAHVQALLDRAEAALVAIFGVVPAAGVAGGIVSYDLHFLAEGPAWAG